MKEEILAAYERISPHLKRAVVAAEDARFLDHDGFDWEAIQKAMAKNERQGKVVVCNAPIVEGSVMAATEASGGASLEEVRRTAEELSPV